VEPRRSLTFADVLREHARSWPRQTAVVDGDVHLSYREVDRRTNRLAHALRNAGVEGGDRILWLGQNSFRLLEALLAAAKLGAIFCPANWRQSAEEMAFVIDDIDARVVFWQDAEIGTAVQAARAASTSSARWLRHDADAADSSSYEGILAAGSDDGAAIDVDPADPLLIIYTAAFGGRPNGAMLSHTALVTQGMVMGRLAEIDAGYVYLNSGPLFHIGTFMTALATFVAAGTNVFTPRVDAEELCRLIEAERCTGAFILGPTFDQMVEVNHGGRYDLTSLRSFGGSAAWKAMTSRDTSPWARNPGGYGQTETVGMLTFNTLAPRDAIGSHGRASPAVQLRIVDTDGIEVADGETGEIVVRGPTVMNGYWNRPEENERRRRGGWHHTNDLGRRAADGTITFVGPRTRMIKSAAENIYPAEVEACIAAHPAVAECAIIGVPDPQWTQSVKAIVVLHDGASATADDIVAHCRSRIASYKKPRTVEFVEKLPRDGWAVDYDALDDRFGGGGYPGGRNRSA
jgi:acyl-CoA synthetase (AMP-forming)/AMP-acid ligase II